MPPPKLKLHLRRGARDYYRHAVEKGLVARPNRRSLAAASRLYDPENKAGMRK